MKELLKELFNNKINDKAINTLEEFINIYEYVYELKDNKLIEYDSQQMYKKFITLDDFINFWYKEIYIKYNNHWIFDHDYNDDFMIEIRNFLSELEKLKRGI